MRRRHLLFVSTLTTLLAGAALAACGMDAELPGGAAASSTASSSGSGGSGGAMSSPYESVPLEKTIQGKGLTSFVDVVRDEQGIPHFYGTSQSDVFYAQGYFQASDRFLQMDLIRRQGEGRLAEIVGALSPSLIDGDIQMRVHHLERTAQEQIDALRGSQDPIDQRTIAGLDSFTAGINAWIADLRAGKASLPKELAVFYDAGSVADWKAADCLVNLGYEEFLQGYAEGDLTNTDLEARAQMVFGMPSADPAITARKDIVKDLFDMRPVDATFTIDGWTGSDGTTAWLDPPSSPPSFLPVLEADRKARRGFHGEQDGHLDFGSNDWVVSGKVSKTGNAMLANDPHLGLNNPPIWWFSQVYVTGDTPFKVMGAGLAGLPAPTLGMNEHVAWGVTDSYIDNTDFYAESVVMCDNSTDPCVMFKGSKVPLTKRTEEIAVGLKGKVTQKVTVDLWEVPHHGPIIPRVDASHMVEPLTSNEISVRWVGHQMQKEATLTNGLFQAKSAKDLVAAIDASWKNVGFNWVAADDQGHIAWTQRARAPRRAPGFAPYKVLPGDGTAEWGMDLDPKYIPHAYDPDKGFLATANNDPIGVTKDGEPFFTEPMVDGAPLYIGWDYDRGTRVDRITTRLTELTANNGKVSLDDMQSIQADAVPNFAKHAAPVFAKAANALAEENLTPGKHPELAAMLAAASPEVKNELLFAKVALEGWTFDTPSALDEESPTAAQISDSRATVVFYSAAERAISAALSDEAAALGFSYYAFPPSVWLHLFTDQTLVGVGLDPTTYDSVLWDDMTTPNVVESRLMITAQALLEGLNAMTNTLGSDPMAWRWGSVHTVTFTSLVPLSSLDIPPPSDPKYPHGFPRHGAVGTVDVANFYGIDDYTYGSGPSMRFVCELTPDGPKGKNALPGGQIFDPASPHFRDLAELWRKNQTFDMAFTDADVVASAIKEQMKNGLGRYRFTP